MFNDLDRELDKAFAPTPASFSRSVDKALRELPQKSAWRLRPAFVAALATLAVFAVFAVVFGGIKVISNNIEDASFATNTATAASLTQAAMPPLAVTYPKSVPSSAIGWQAAAVAGDAAWYFKQSTGEIAYVEAGKTTAIALGLKQGQAVDAYTFLPDKEGQWVAFTVHGGAGDSVWVVTKGGRKMAVPEDVQWVDNYNNPVQADFSGASMIAYGSDYYLEPTEDVNDPVPDSVRIKAAFPNGELYELNVSLNTKAGHPECLLDYRKGDYYTSWHLKNEGETLVTGKEYLYKIIQEDGKYFLSLWGTQMPVDLQSDRFALFKLPGQNQMMYPARALMVYAGDASRTLWELNIETGKASKIATGCLAADWTDDSSYWYAAQADSARVLKHEAADLHNVRTQLMLIQAGGDSNEDINTSIVIQVIVQNLTDQDITIPENVPCDLRISRDGEILWQKNGLSLPADITTRRIFLDSVLTSPIGDSTRKIHWPVVVPPGYTLEFGLPGPDCTGTGTYTLDGSFNNSSAIHCVIPVGMMLNLPVGVGLQGKILEDGRLQATLDNRSRATFTLLQSTSQFRTPQSTNQYGTEPPVVCYRLLSSGRIVDAGRLEMAGEGWSSEIVHIPPGVSLTMTEDSAAPKFAGLPAGQYTLECYLEWLPEQNKDFEKLPWGLNGGFYFDVPFVVSGK
jgi:hypothetical protein